ncbi:MAG: DNA repair protein RecO, partial [Pseudomonadota bacterium]
MSRITLQPCFVLHSKPFRNTSVIVDAFSRDYGRVVLVARGVRNRKRGEANAVEPFRPMLYSWQGRGEMYTLTASEEAEQAPVLRRLQGEALYCGYYVNELLLSLLARDDPHTDVFSLYESTIASLDDQDSEREISLRKFEIG